VSDQPEEVEYITPAEDAQIRLTCFEATKTGAHDFTSNMEQAKTLYAWIMGYEDGETADVSASREPECTRKH
jgi:hypothetical protein